VNVGQYQKYLLSNLIGLVATAALTCALVAGLFVGIAQVRCTLLEEDVARLKGRLAEATETLKTEQETAHKAVLGVVDETVKRVAAHLEESRETEAKQPAAEESPKDEPAKEPE
jgi:hypothetical protein